jgi:hypothetical protein
MPNDNKRELIWLVSAVIPLDDGDMNLPDTDKNALAEWWADIWDVLLKGVNYLLIAHAAGLVTCLTLLKDYKDNPQLKGLGGFIGLFGFGLIFAITALVGLITAKFRMGIKFDQKSLSWNWAMALAHIGGFGSLALLLVTIFFLIGKFARL